MASPTTAITRLDLSMSFSEFSAAMNRMKFIGHRVFPPLVVNENSETFRVIKAQSLITPIENTKRAPKGEYARDDWEWGTDSYKTDEHGVEEITDDRQLKMYHEVDAEAINRDRALNRVAQAYENTAAGLAFDTAYFTGDYTIDVDATTTLGRSGEKWSVKASADPIADIDAARDQFITNSGHSPNALVLEEAALRSCLRTDRIEELTKYTGQIDSLMMRNLVPQLQDLFRLEKIIVADAPIKNTAGRGQDPTLSRVWGTDKALLCRIYDGPDIEAPEPFFGRTIMWGEEMGPLPGSNGEGMGVLVEEYREESRRGGVIRARTDYDIKRFYKPAGLLLTNVR